MWIVWMVTMILIAIKAIIISEFLHGHMVNMATVHMPLIHYLFTIYRKSTELHNARAIWNVLLGNIAGNKDNAFPKAVPKPHVKVAVFGKSRVSGTSTLHNDVSTSLQKPNRL